MLWYCLVCRILAGAYSMVSRVIRFKVSVSVRPGFRVRDSVRVIINQHVSP